MRIRIRYAAGIFLAVLCIAAAGCSSSKKEETGTIPDGKELKPEQVVELFFNDLQMSQVDGTEKYFSSELPKDLVVNYVHKFYEEKEIGRYKAMPVGAPGKDSAKVKIIFKYNKRKAEYISDKDFVGKMNLEMAKDDGIWKIRRMNDPELDDKVQVWYFQDCMNAVMDTTIAEEKLRQARDQYSDSMGALLKAYPYIKEDACKEIVIREARKEFYLITAMTKNDKPCEIVANTDAHTPETYGECLAEK